MIYRSPTSTESAMLHSRCGYIPFHIATARDHDRASNGIRASDPRGAVLLHGDKLTAAHIEEGTCCFACAEQIDDPNMLL